MSVCGEHEYVCNVCDKPSGVGTRPVTGRLQDSARPFGARCALRLPVLQRDRLSGIGDRTISNKRFFNRSSPSRSGVITDRVFVVDRGFVVDRVLFVDRSTSTAGGAEHSGREAQFRAYRTLPYPAPDLLTDDCC